MARKDQEGLLVADGYDAAILGFTFGDTPKVIYDVSAIITTLTKQGMAEQEAIEFFDFNILGAHVGPNTPMYVEVL